MVIFVFIVVVAARACFVVAQDDISRLCALLVQRVSRAWRMAQVSRGCIFYCFFASFLSRVFLLFLMFLSWEMRHEYAQSSWGFLFRGPPGYCVCRTCVAAIDAPLTMIVVAGWVSSWYSRCPHNAFVAFVGKAALWLCRGSPCCVRRLLISWVLWRFTIMASIVSIAISDGFNCAHPDWQWHRCLLLLVATVPIYNTCNVFTARIFNSLITIQTELSLD